MPVLSYFIDHVFPFESCIRYPPPVATKRRSPVFKLAQSTRT